MARPINCAVVKQREKRMSIVKKAPGLAAIFALLLSAYSLGLVMLGYGYDLAYLGEFGLNEYALNGFGFAKFRTVFKGDD